MLALTLTQTAPTTSCFLEILDFYECATAIMSDSSFLKTMEVAIPPPLLVYSLFFSQSLAVVSRLCGIQAARPMTAGEKRATDKFNSFLMDICNCLVRSHAFSTSDLNARGCLVPETLVQALRIYAARVDSDFSLESMLNLSYSPVLSLQSISYFRQEEDGDLEDPAAQIEERHAGPVTQNSLMQLGKRGGLQMNWQEYRSGVLEYLEEQGVPGIPSLMFSTMKSMKRVKP
jgi:centromere protein I